MNNNIKILHKYLAKTNCSLTRLPVKVLKKKMKQNTIKQRRRIRDRERKRKKKRNKFAVRFLFVFNSFELKCGI